MIRLNDRYVITVDERQYCLCKRTVVKEGENKGKENIVPFAYCKSLIQALERFSQQSIVDRLKDADMDLQTAVYTIRECNKEIADLIGKACPEVRVIE